jgi:hypothetical protein
LSCASLGTELPKITAHGEKSELPKPCGMKGFKKKRFSPTKHEALTSNPSPAKRKKSIFNCHRPISMKYSKNYLKKIEV